MDLKGKTIVITGAAKRIGKAFALAAAQDGANIILHYGRSQVEAFATQKEIENLGTQCNLVQADFSNPKNTLEIFQPIFEEYDIYALVNNASIFRQNKLKDTSLADWQIHQDVNLTVPHLLIQAYAKSQVNQNGRVINMLDWRALRPGKDHFAYTISKAGLVALTRSAALALAPHFQVNGLALGAILPPSDGGDTEGIIKHVPAQRWAKMEELIDAFLFLLKAPAYITGEIIHVDGGRHLV